MIMWKRLMIKVILIIRGMINDIRLIIRLLTLKYFFLNPKGWRPYPFCHAKRQSDLLGGWVGKNMFIMTFCVTNWFQRIPIQKKKYINKYKKLQCTHVCFPFHHVNYLGGTGTRRVFKFYLRTQSAEKGSHFTLL